MAQYYDYREKKSYKELDFRCVQCDWRGSGEQATDGEDTPDGFSLHCPKCNHYLDWIDFRVSFEDLVVFGSVEDRVFDFAGHSD
ncbi:MAG: hypothetical protein LBE83_03245 [Propionibacteriaceae bacterium]|jgi:hypothetical protein|nr:hypothetical protein [Propionibacteriaceae bacterium]